MTVFRLSGPRNTRSETLLQIAARLHFSIRYEPSALPRALSTLSHNLALLP